MNRTTIAFAGLLATMVPTLAADLSAEQILTVQNSVREALKDPDSAKFKSLVASDMVEGTATVCGYVNAKNSLGGYTGDTPFVGLLMDVATKQGPSVSIFSVGLVGGEGAINQAVADMCATKGIELAGF